MHSDFDQLKACQMIDYISRQFRKGFVLMLLADRFIVTSFRSPARAFTAVTKMGRHFSARLILYESIP